MKPLDFTINGVRYWIDTNQQLKALMEATAETLPAVLKSLPQQQHATAA